MSEDEAIKILKEITPDDLLDCWDGGEKEFKAIDTILDSYQQEKEKNKKIKNKIHLVLFKHRYTSPSNIDILYKDVKDLLEEE